MKDGKELFIPRMIFILLLLFQGIIHAQFTPIQVTTNTKYQIYPSVWGNRIVWQDDRNKTGFTINYDTYMYTLPSGPEQRINLSTLRIKAILRYGKILLCGATFAMEIEIFTCMI